MMPWRPRITWMCTGTARKVVGAKKAPTASTSTSSAASKPLDTRARRWQHRRAQPPLRRTMTHLDSSDSAERLGAEAAEAGLRVSGPEPTGSQPALLPEAKSTPTASRGISDTWTGGFFQLDISGGE